MRNLQETHRGQGELQSGHYPTFKNTTIVASRQQT